MNARMEAQKTRDAERTKAAILTAAAEVFADKGFDGSRVANVDDLHLALTEDRIGRSIDLEVLRSGHAEHLVVVPGELA